jgi:flagellar M-ring protein FliF
MIGLEQLERLWRSLLALGARRLAALAVVGLAVFAAVGLGSYYLSRPQLETLYSGLTATDVNRIGAALNEAGIAFDVNSQGTAVLVRYGQTAHARMLLAEKGLPSSANAGYELFDKLGSMGLTSFMQEITRVRALEGEIARTIQVMKCVKAARVHLVLSDAGSFRRARQSPSASVIVRAESAGDFASAPAIRHLVAAAVPGLGIDQVTVLNTDGTILASGGDTITAAPGKMLTLEKSIGKELQDNVGRTLAPYLGASNFEISVAVRLNTDKRQINETAYNPESRVERSVRVIKETGTQQNSTNRSAVGVEQNVPVEQQSTSSGSGDQSKRANERREELTNYEVSTKTISTVSEGYKIEHLAIAVVVNRKPCSFAGRQSDARGRRQAVEGDRAPGLVRSRHRRQAGRSHHGGGPGIRGQCPDLGARSLGRDGRASAPQYGQHRQCRRLDRGHGAADLVRLAAGFEDHSGNAGGQTEGRDNGRR